MVDGRSGRGHRIREAEAPSLVELLRLRAASHCDAPVFTFVAGDGSPVERLTYRQLDTRAREIATALAPLCPAGERALLLYPPGLEYIAAFFGCLYAGVIAVPAYPPDPRALHRSLPRLQTVVRDAAPSIALSNAAIVPLAQAFSADLPDMQRLRWLATDVTEPDASGWRPLALGAESLAFLQYTSGSTGTPRGVVLTHGNLLANQRMIERSFQLSDRTVAFGWLPLYHDMGLIGNVVQTVYLGAHCLLMSPLDFLQRPARWLEAITQHGVGASGGPNFAYDLCVRKVTEEERARLDLSSWKLAFCGAEPVRADTFERFQRAFGPVGFHRASFFPCYGLAEATLIVSGGPAAEPVVRRVNRSALEQGRVADDDTGRALVASGEPIEENEVRIVAPETATPRPDDVVGEIWVRAPSVARGYWGDPAATEAVFGARLANGDGPFLRTGDLGFLSGGQLYVSGRLKDLIIVRGRNHFPQDIEDTVEHVSAALRPGCGAAFTVDVPEGIEEGLVVVQELKPGHDEDAPAVTAAIRRAIAEHHELQVHAIVLVRAGTISKTSSGKIQRRQCRHEYLQGALAVVWDSREQPPAGTAGAHDRTVATDTESVEGRLTAMLSARTGVPVSAIDPSAPVTALGLDSLRVLELQTDIHEAYGVAVSLADLLDGPSVRELARRLDSTDTVTATADPTVGGSAPDGILSVGQEALWHVQRLEPDSGAYNVAVAARIRGGCDPTFLQRAFDALVARHSALRMVFVERDGRPRAATQALRARVDVLEAPGPDALGARLAADAGRPFDLTAGPLLRLSVYRSEPDDVLLLTVHHSVMDLWSMALLVRELASFDRAGASLSPSASAVEYSSFAAWQHRMLASAEGEAHARYWETQLAGTTGNLPLPTDHRRDPGRRVRAASRFYELDAATTARVEALARDRGASTFSVLLTAFHLLLGRYAGTADVLVGVPTSGRTHPKWSDVVGYFANLVPVRARLRDSASFEAAVDHVGQQLAEAIRHQDYPFAKIVERVEPPREPGRGALVQVTFAFQTVPFSETEQLGCFALGVDGAPLTVGGLELEALALPHTGSSFELALYATVVGGRTVLRLDYDDALFEQESILRLLRNYETLVAAAIERPSAPVGRLPLVAASELDALAGRNRGWLDDRARSSGPLGGGEGLHAIFSRQAIRTPDAVAVQHAGHPMTYRELDRRSEQLAHYLRARGVGPGGLVAICVERTHDLMVGLLGILKAGGAFVPIDPAYPRERRAHMLADSGAHLLLTQATLLDSHGLHTRDVLCLDRDWARVETAPPSDACPVSLEHLAWVMYTSGSTGMPKGAALTHRCATSFIAWAVATFSPQELAGTLACTSICFDPAIFELFAPLAVGGTVVLVANGLDLPVHASASVPPITLINTVPSVMTEILASRRLPSTVQTVNLCGEPLKDSLVQATYAHPHVAHVNDLYGPVECTIYATHARRKQGPGSVETIGGPLANTRVYVLDSSRQPLPMGVPGELYIGGAGLARGYHRRPGLTAERFVPDASGDAPGERLYRTGDRARFRYDGDLEYLGRVDHQIKLRGVRIELGEVEAALRAHPSVSEAAVALHHGPVGDMLVAYVTTPAPLVVAELRAFVRARLPDQSVPGGYVRLDTMPLTPSGKLDRRALPPPDSAGAMVTGAAPASRTERTLAELWAGLLGVRHVSADDDFFSLGGHSLLANQLVSRVRVIFEVELPVRAVFEAPLLRRLAGRVDALARIEDAPIERVERVGEDGAYALSFAQERLWFLWRLDPTSTAYHMPAAVRLRGRVDVDALTAALDSLQRRHESLRTRFAGLGDQPVAVIAAAPACALEVVRVDASALRDAIEDRVRAPFDLGQGPVMRASLMEMSQTDSVLVVVMHHIVSDGWSVRRLIDELGLLYGAARRSTPPDLGPLPAQYVDYAAWQRREMCAEALEPALATWAARLADAPTHLSLPTDRPRGPDQGLEGAHVPVELSPSLVDAVTRLAREEGVTLFMALLGAFGVVLARHAGQPDVLIGTPSANRPRPELEGVVGLFVNTLVMRVDLRRRPTVRTLLGAVREMALGAYAGQHVPLEKVIDRMQPERVLGSSPLFQVLFSLQTEPTPQIELDELEAEVMPVDRGATQLDLTLDLAHREDGAVVGRLEYRASLFDRGTIEPLVGHLVRVLEGFVAQPNASALELSMLDAAERRRLVEVWSGQDEPETGAGTWSGGVLARFEALAAARPHVEALCAGETRITYGELDRTANQLAHWLCAHGVGADDVVALCMDRCAETVIGLLAAWKAGAAYLPIDPALPAARRRAMIHDARATVTIGGPTVELLAGCHGWVSWADAMEAAVSEPMTAPLVDRTGESLAYVIYTSGSTGSAKGVGVSHRNLEHSTRVRIQHYRDPVQAYVLLQSFAFDSSVAGLFWTLGTGGALVLPDPEQCLDPRHVLDLIEQHGATHMGSVPAFYELLLEEADEQLASLRVVFVAGEANRAGLAATHRRRLPRCALWNEYGPTEATVWCTAERCFIPDDSSGPPAELIAPGSFRPCIGHPIAGSRVFVVDSALEPVPRGVAGELLVGGPGITRGYLGRPGLTAEVFVPDPFSAVAGARAYRTRDRVRHLADASLEFGGRIDRQVKVRGFRIELGEVESTLQAHAAIADAVVVADDKGDHTELVAFYATSTEVEPTALAEALGTTLPQYMIPTAWVRVPTIERNRRGKIDRSALRRPAPSAPAVGGDTPCTPTESRLRAIWAEVLGTLASLDPDVGFFAVGGHSLAATRVVARVRRELGVDLPLRAMFEAPTIRQLARRIDATTRQSREEPQIERVDRAHGLALSFAQERLWFLATLDPTSIAYHIPAAVRLRGALDVEALQGAFALLVARHESLRTRFVGEGDRVVQVIDDDGPSLAIVEMTADELPAWLDDAIRQPFDLARGPLMRPTLCRLKPDEAVLFVVSHHIITDGWSVGRLIEELALLYGAVSDGNEAALPPLPIQYADYAAWQRRWMHGAILEDHARYWREALTGAPTLIDLPTDFPRPTAQSHEGARVSFELDPPLVAALERLAEAEQATLFMVMLAGLGAVLARYSGQADMLVGSPIANRTRAEVEPVVGLFVNTLVMRVDLRARPTAREAVRSVREMALGAYAHQHLPLEKLIDLIQPERSLGATPLFQVLLVLQNTPTGPVRLAELEVEPMDLERGAAQLDLALHLTPTAEGGLAGAFEYLTALFEPPTIVQIGSHFREVLEGFVLDADRPVLELPLTVEPPEAGREVRGEELPLALVERIAAWANEDPSAPAIVDGPRVVTRGELEGRAVAAAAALRADGVGVGDFVAVAAAGPVERLVAQLGVLEAGAAFLTLRGADGDDTSAFEIARDLKVTHVIGDGAGLAVAPTDLRRVDLTTLPPQPRASVVRVHPLGPACIVRTDGVRGRLEPVIHTHTSFAAARRGAGAADCFAALENGAAVIFAAVTGATLEAEPSGACYAVAEVGARWPCSPELPRRVAMDTDAACLDVLDASLQTVPFGVRGEVFAAGPAVAAGYAARPGLTASTFRPDPRGARPGDRCVATGDLGRRERGRRVSLLGRRQDRVQLRGAWLALGDVDRALQGCPAARDAAVAVVTRAGRRELVAYVVLAGDPEVETGLEAVRGYARTHLAPAHRPTSWVVVSALPRTPAGKIIRVAMRGLEGRRHLVPGTVALSETEQLLSAIWSDVLGVSSIGRHDDFFELGGNSIIATRVVTHVKRRLDVELSVRDLFEHPTLAELASRLDAIDRSRDDDALALESLDDEVSRLDEMGEDQLDALLRELGDE